MESHLVKVNNLIEYHQKRIKRINLMMWVLIISAVVIYFLISVLLDAQINKIISIVQVAVENGIQSKDSAPPQLASASQNNGLGMIVLGMFAARLLVYFGEMRFHMKSLSEKENYLISFIRIDAALTEQIDSNVKYELFNNAFNSINKQEPSLHLPSETITKISDAIIEKVEKVISGKGN